MVRVSQYSVELNYLLTNGDEPLFVINKSNFTQNCCVFEKLNRIEIYSNKVIAIKKTNERIPISYLFYSLPDFSIVDPAQYFTRHSLNVSQMSDGDYRLTAFARGLAGGVHWSKFTESYDDLERYAQNGNIEKIQHYIHHKWDLDGGEGYLKPLGWAVIGGQTEAVRILLEAGANPNSSVRIASSTPTVLMHAATNNRPDIVKLLVEQGADLTLKDKNGNTALDLVRGHEGYNEVLTLLYPKLIQQAQEISNTIAQRTITLTKTQNSLNEKEEQHFSSIVLSVLIDSEYIRYLSSSDKDNVLS